MAFGQRHFKYFSILVFYKEQAPVVQRADNSIQQITHYPADKTYQFQYILFTR